MENTRRISVDSQRILFSGIVNGVDVWASYEIMAECKMPIIAFRKKNDGVYIQSQPFFLSDSECSEFESVLTDRRDMIIEKYMNNFLQS
jgi:hypothetical protein